MGKVVAIITAGGSGKRIKSKIKKQYIEINQRPILFWTLDKFVHHKEIDEIIISLPEEDIEVMKVQLEKEFPGSALICVKGGTERQNSVFNALVSCPKDTEYVLIHDGVRPFISQNDISNLIKEAEQKRAVIPVSKVKNTIKEINEDKIIRTVSRTQLVSALTPQVFHYDLIFEYHEKAREENIQTTDDASILEHYGVEVFTLECSSKNIKITDQFDLEIAKFIIKNNMLGEE